MGIWRHISSGGKNYTDYEASDGSHTVRRNDGFFWSTGTRIGQTDSLEDSLDATKSDSGGGDVRIKTR